MAIRVFSKTPANAEPVTRPSRLRGTMGVLGLLLIAIAFNGPMAVFTGFVPLMVSFGNGEGAPLLFITLGGVILVFAVGLNTMAKHISHPGAFYTYISQGIGRIAGLGAGAGAMISYLTFGAGTYALFALSIEQMLRLTLGIDSSFSWWAWAVVGWIICTTLSMMNIDVSAKVLGIAAALEILIVLIWDLVGFSDPNVRVADVAPFENYFSGSIVWGLVFGVVAMVGFESLQVFRAETKDPARTVPRATYIFIGIITGLYALSSLSYLAVLGPETAIARGGEDPQGTVLSSIATILGPVFADIAVILLATSSFAACLAIQNVASRYVFQFGRDGILPSSLGRADEKHSSPLRAAFTAGLAMLLLLGLCVLLGEGALNTWVKLVGVGSLGIIILWAVTSVAVLLFFAKDRRGESSLNSLVAPAISAAMFSTILVLTLFSFTDVMGGDQFAAYAALAAVGTLIVAGLTYGIWLRKHRPHTYTRIGSMS